MNPIVLRFLEMEALRWCCSPVMWTEDDDVLIMQALKAREMVEAG